MVEAVRLVGIHLQDYRNIALARLHFEGSRIFFQGPNGQGKTNLLEAIGYATAMRSFRSSDYHHLMKSGTRETGILYFFADHRNQESQLEIRLRPGSRELRLGERKVPRLGEIIGQFPVVVFSSQDLQILRGPPGLRRRWLDMTLATTSPSYLQVLREYQDALQSRNALLRKPPFREEFFAPFEALLVDRGWKLRRYRSEGIQELSRQLAGFYDELTGGLEKGEMHYLPGIRDEEGAEAWKTRLAAQRERDHYRGGTGEGPHRDDWGFTLNGEEARTMASEGQQRGLVLALGLAQSRYFASLLEEEPILLADDILGELDEERRVRFWSLLPPQAQIFATGTSWPQGLGSVFWERWQVKAGTFQRRASEDSSEAG